MIKVVLICGANIEAVLESIDTEKYNVVKTHNFIQDAFDDILTNYTEYLDVDVIVALQYGIKDKENKENQIRDFDEAVDSAGLSAKTYYLLNDKSLYNIFAESEEPLLYDKSRIILLQNIYNKSIMDTIEGKMDTVGIAPKKEEQEDTYNEDDLEPEEDEGEKIFKEEPEEPTEINEPEEDNVSVKDLRKGKKGRKGIPLLGKETDKIDPISEPRAPRQRNSVGRYEFGGVIAVTGDRGSGVSTTASNIAETYAKSGKTVLLIDLDFTRRFMSIIYKDLAQYEVVQPKTQMGLYYSLSNPNVVDELSIIVKDNLALLGNSRGSEYYRSPIVDVTLADLEEPHRVTNLIGVAKSLYDVVVLDFPLEQLQKLIEVSIIVDRFVLCVENNLHQIDNLFNISFAQIMYDSELYVKTIFYRSTVVLTKYSAAARYGKRELSVDIVEDILQQTVYPKITVAGKISYSNAYQKIGETNKNVIDLHDTIRDDFIGICENIRM